MATQLSRSIVGQIIIEVLRRHAGSLNEALRPVWQSDKTEYFLNPDNWRRQSRALNNLGYEYNFSCVDLAVTATVIMAKDDRTICSLMIEYHPSVALAIQAEASPSFSKAARPDWNCPWQLSPSPSQLAAALLTSPDREMRLMAASIIGKSSQPSTGAPRDLKISGLNQPPKNK